MTRVALFVSGVVTGIVLLGLFGNWGSPAESGGGGESAARPADVIVEVDGIRITEAQWNDALAGYPDLDKKRLLQSELQRLTVLSAATRAGFAEDPAVKKRLEAAMIARFIQSELDVRLAEVTVSDRELRDYLESNPLQAPEPLRRAAVIRQIVDEGEDREAARQALVDARGQVARLDSPIAHFAELAARYSDDQATRHRGGVSGYFRAERSEHDRMPAAVHEALWTLTGAGEVSDIVDTGDALWLVRFVDEMTSGGQSVDAQRNAAERRLLELKRGQARAKFFEELADQADVFVAEDWQVAESSEPGEQVPVPPAMPGT